jgi:hypothetical protein
MTIFAARFGALPCGTSMTVRSAELSLSHRINLVACRCTAICSCVLSPCLTIILYNTFCVSNRTEGKA